MFSVRWTPRALALLTEAWLAADSNERRAITTMIRKVEQVLRVSADRVGESRIGNSRVLVRPPVGIEYWLILDDRVVDIARVWHVRRRRS